MTSPWRTGWSASSPMGPSFTHWGGITNKLVGLLVVVFVFSCSNRQWKVGPGMEKKLAERGSVGWIWDNMIAKQGVLSILLLGHWIVWVREHVICQYKELWAIKPTQVLLASFQHLLLCVQELNVWRALGKLLKHALAFWLDIGPSRQVIGRKVIDDPESEFVQLF